MIEQVRPAEWDDWVQAQAARPLVLDVREPWELQVASIAEPGFDVLAIPMNQLPARLAELPADRPIACLCHHGVRSQRVALFLDQQSGEQKSGVRTHLPAATTAGGKVVSDPTSSVVNIAGGIDAWARERDPSVPVY